MPPFPVQWPTAERRHDVLVVGEGDYSYSRSLIARHADWYITTSDYGDGSNNQEIVGTYNNAIKVANVDATRLGIGAITGSNKYDVIIFNAPRATEGPFFSASGDLVERVLLSAQDVLKPGGQVRFSGTKAYPASPRLEQLILRIPSGYSQASKVPFLSDANYGIPYNALTLDGKSLNPNFREWNWYIFIK